MIAAHTIRAAEGVDPDPPRIPGSAAFYRSIMVESALRIKHHGG